MAWTRRYEEAEPQRVNRWLAQNGVCSRREAEDLIARGLVSSRTVGRVRTCQLQPAALQEVERWIEQRRTAWERGLDRLGAYLADTADKDEGSST